MTRQEEIELIKKELSKERQRLVNIRYNYEKITDDYKTSYAELRKNEKILKILNNKVQEIYEINSTNVFESVKKNCINIKEFILLAITTIIPLILLKIPFKEFDNLYSVICFAVASAIPLSCEFYYSLVSIALLIQEKRRRKFIKEAIDVEELEQNITNRKRNITLLSNEVNKMQNDLTEINKNYTERYNNYKKIEKRLFEIDYHDNSSKNNFLEEETKVHINEEKNNKVVKKVKVKNK